MVANSELCNVWALVLTGIWHFLPFCLLLGHIIPPPSCNIPVTTSLVPTMYNITVLLMLVVYLPCKDFQRGDQKQIWKKVTTAKYLCMLTVHVGWACWLCMLTVHVGCACWLCMLTVHVGCACWLCMLTGQKGMTKTVIIYFVGTVDWNMVSIIRCNDTQHGRKISRTYHHKDAGIAQYTLYHHYDDHPPCRFHVVAEPWQPVIQERTMDHVEVESLHSQTGLLHYPDLHIYGKSKLVS